MRDARLHTWYAELRKGGERFIFIVREDRVGECMKIMSRWAMTADLAFGLNDAEDIVKCFAVRAAMKEKMYGHTGS